MKNHLYLSLIFYLSDFCSCTIKKRINQSINAHSEAIEHYFSTKAIINTCVAVHAITITMKSSSTLRAPIISSMITGSISFAASLTLIVMILRSDLKLSTVYRRLIFGISVFDLVQSLSQGMSSLPMPAGSIWAAVGNNVTCDLQGFTTVVGVHGSVLYTLSLSVYFLFALKYEVSGARIKKFVEPFLHTIPITMSLSIGIYFYATDTYNPSGSFCWINPQPVFDCVQLSVSQKECLTKHSDLIFLISSLMSFPLALAIVGNCAVLFMLWYTEYKQSVKTQRERLLVEEQQLPNTSYTTTSSTAAPRSPGGSLLASRLARPSRASKQRRIDIRRRAIAYIIGFACTYFFAIIARYWEVAAGRAPFAIILITRTLYPLQGFFNLLIYTYPHADAYHRRHRCSWFKAFVKIIRAGGDSDQHRELRPTLRRQRHTIQRRNSIRNEPVVTDIIDVLDIVNRRPIDQVRNPINDTNCIP